MPTANTPASYGSVARAFHWLTALLILANLPLGVIAAEMPFDTAEALARKAQLFSVHKTLGVAIFAVALARILWALTQPRPAPLHPGRRLETFLAETVHWALYLSLVVVPLSGWVHHAAVEGFAPILWPLGQGLPFVPVSDAVAQAAEAVHWVFTKLLFASVALHVLGALKHVFIDRDGTLARMTRGTPSAGTPHRSPAPMLAALALFAAGFGLAWSLSAPAPTETARPAAGAGNWQVETGTLTFAVKQMGAEVQGSLPVWTADITYDPATGTGTVKVAIDTTQVTLGAVTDQAKGADFFATASHPTATFTADISPAGTGRQAKGTLTLRGVETPVTLPFTLTPDGDTATMTGTTTLDRRDFGMGAAYTDESQIGFAVTVQVALTARKAK
ncbi:cytochrome b/b6 domain-containing protein [Rhodobacter sp. Har01]|uniref:cytochrome b/b6 domain-containing protein n=1 Tax=Rhodobacter sp. Har01 TaxID=2883999 RepID=UPI001D097BA9|nr:cytochrome b/b6 domain-containing protein [Rhodobacter sp. Har01]MCB6176969.1 cytochrome b/b6 domain-containing protein [Rhodobacter sp. Har01]